MTLPVNPSGLLMVPSGTSEEVETKSIDWAARHVSEDIRRLLTNFFSSQKGVDGKLKKIEFHTRRFPRLDQALVNMHRQEVADWHHEIEIAGANKAKAEAVEQAGPIGPAIEVAVYNRSDVVDNVVETDDWFACGYALPIQIITQKKTLTQEDAVLAMVVMLTPAFDITDYTPVIDGKRTDLTGEITVDDFEGIPNRKALLHIAPFDQWPSMFDLEKLKLIDPRKPLQDELLQLLLKAHRKFWFHGDPLKETYGSRYNHLGTIIEYDIVSIINNWGFNAGYPKLLMNCTKWGEEPSSITKNFRFNWETVRGLEETSALTESTQTEIIESLVRNHIGEYAVARIKTLRNENRDFNALQGDWHRWKAAIDRYKHFKISDSIDGDKAVEKDKASVDRAMENVNYHVESLYQWVSEISGKPVNEAKPRPNLEPQPNKIDHFHFAVEASENPMKQAMRLQEVMYEKPFKVEPTGTEMDDHFAALKPAFYNIASYYFDSPDFQQIVGYETLLPDPGVRFEDFVEEYNRQFEDFVGGRLEERDCARLTVAVLNGINGTNFTNESYTNAVDVAKVIIPDLRTIQIEELISEETYEIDADEAARLMQEEEYARAAYEEYAKATEENIGTTDETVQGRDDVIDGGEF